MEKVNWRACSRVCCKYFWWKTDAGHHGSPQFCHLCMQTQEKLCMAWALYSTLVSQPMVLVALVPSVPTSFHFVLRTGRTHLQARRNIRTLYISPWLRFDQGPVGGQSEEYNTTVLNLKRKIVFVCLFYERHYFIWPFHETEFLETSSLLQGCLRYLTEHLALLIKIT